MVQDPIKFNKDTLDFSYPAEPLYWQLEHITMVIVTYNGEHVLPNVSMLTRLELDKKVVNTIVVSSEFIGYFSQDFV